MQLVAIFAGLCAISLATAESRIAKVFLQPVHNSAAPPSLLAEVEYDVAVPSAAEVTSFEAPEIPDDATLVRIGLYDPKSSTWLSSTSVASVENFSRGYSPRIMLSLDSKGDVVGASCRGVRVDAGQTRDFGPQALVTVAGKGKHPELNKPVVLSPEGKKVVQEEKSLLQKYHSLVRLLCSLLLTWLQILVANSRCPVCIDDWWRRRRLKIMRRIIFHTFF